MAETPFPVPDERLVAYWRAASLREAPELRALRLATEAMPESSAATGPEQAQFLAFLVELIGARRIVEVGTFTGYGTLAMALAAPVDARLVTLDVNEHWGRIGEAHWQRAGIAGRIERRIGMAQDGLDALLAEGWAGHVDLVYIDADKKTYPAYLARARKLIRPGGLIAMDNMFWGGSVADPADTSKQAKALRAVTEAVRDDGSLAVSLVPIGDGLLLLRQR